MDLPEVRYARSGGAAIAYAIVGEGPPDLVYMPGFISHAEYLWEGDRASRFFRRLASFSRLILVDRRGTGLSDPMIPDAPPPFEVQMDDLKAVLGDVGSAQAALFGVGIGAMLCALFAASYPNRVSACVLYGSAACGTQQPDYPWQMSPDEWEEYFQEIHQQWGSQQYAQQMLSWLAPSMRENQEELAWWGRLMRLAVSPSSALALERLYRETDARSILGSVSVPAIVAHRTADPVQHIEGGRYIAAHIPGATLVELPGTDWIPWGDDQDALLDAVEEFLTGTTHGPGTDRVLATVLLTDIVDSTRRAAELGDAGWKEAISAHDERARAAIGRFRGRYVNSTGDGILATFDGPARAVRCAQEIADAVRPLTLQIRAGCHTGEVELAGDDVRGIAVHIGARIAAIAGSDEVVVSSTVKELTVGSGLTFEDMGEHELKGVPDSWRLHRVVA